MSEFGRLLAAVLGLAVFAIIFGSLIGLFVGAMYVVMGAMR